MSQSPYQIIRRAMAAQYDKLHRHRAEAEAQGNFDEWRRLDEMMKDHRNAMDKFYDIARFFKEAQV